MKKVFVNCGGHNGDSLKRFIELYDKRNEYTYHSFEPNPAFIECYNNIDRHTLYKNGVWINKEQKKFYISNETRLSGKGAYDSTLLKQKAANHHYLTLEDYVDVECIDFSGWVKCNIEPDNFNVLKMDIEGAEYDVLNKMIVEKTIDYFNYMLIEWHWNKCGINKNIHIDIINKLPFSLKVYNKWKHTNMF